MQYIYIYIYNIYIYTYIYIYTCYISNEDFFGKNFFVSFLLLLLQNAEAVASEAF